MARLSNALRLSCAAGSLVLLAGCVVAGDVRPYPAMAPVVPVVAPSAEPSAGAIYAAGPGLNLYGDRRARDVGDLLTITLVESTSATTSANTAIGKKSSMNIGSPSLFGAPVTLGGKDVLAASASGERDFNALVTKIKSTGANAVYFGGLIPEGGPLIRQIREQGLDVVFISGDSFAQKELIAAAGGAILEVSSMS
ncbi:MAG: flagellar basal body L-ring protein FlgH [Stenotrophomonas nitritireducens]|uniref:Flagellar basal body L-ring protein FlgH n=1 Tax=Stenotrophomonas nitritireducens TaxID=83617 RepID=A0A9D8PYY6_9GAMM|nr:flagellar basal body L-ring protein FlgH [Stenotrophomonas nitritireducens]